MSEASPFTITERGGQKRSVVLLGRGLPYRGLPFTTEQRAPIVWNPGALEGTGTVLGATEQPTNINGQWKDKFLDITGGFQEADTESAARGRELAASRGQTNLAGEPPITVDGQAITTARAAVDLFDSIVREGQLLDVTWFTTKRQGYLKRFSHTWQNTHDVEWSMQFDWIGRGEPANPVVFVTGTQPTASFDAMNLQMKLLDLIDVEVPFDLSFLNEITTFINAIQDAIYQLEDIVLNLVDQILSPIRAIRGMIATISGIGNECALMIEYLGARIAESFAPIPLGGADSMPEAEKLALALYREELKAWARAMQRQATTQRDTLSKQIDGELSGAYTARAGEDLRDVSRKFYGTPYEWRRIMLFNDLDSAELTAGQYVLVPKINPADALSGDSG